MTDAEHGLVPLTPMRAAIARRMSQSKRDAPHIYLTTAIELDALLARLAAPAPTDIGDARDAALAGHAVSARPSVTAALVRAVTLALGDEPSLNAHWTEAGPVRHKAVNLGIAIALDGGLIAPALLGADRLDMPALTVALADLVNRARAGKLRASEVSDATFTLSNLGMYPILEFAAIINPPQVAILAVGRAEPQARVAGGEVVVRSVLHATLSADHRAVDGAIGARFLGRLKELLETPGTWIDGDG
jgi:pyruvate dehydrogenase E2 component (dihydrolipoamide acetyltransferase)